MESASDDELLQRIAAGESDALERLLHLYRERILTYIERHLPAELRDSIDAQDVLQDTFAAAFRRLKSFVPNGEDPAYRWLVTIARNRIINLVRFVRAAKRKGPGAKVNLKQDDDSGVVLLLEEAAIHSHTPSRSAVLHELHGAMDKALQALPEDYQTALRLRHLQGLTCEEAATKMNRTTRAFQMLCNRGLKALREQMHSMSYYV